MAPAMVRCNACNKDFDDDEQKRLHYRSEWHRYNLKRKVSELPGVTETLFQAKLLALSEQNSRLDAAASMTYSCTICGKDYKSSQAYAQHQNSRSHLIRASQKSHPRDGSATIVKPTGSRQATRPYSSKRSDAKATESEESNDEWEEVDPNSMDGVSESCADMHVNESGLNHDEDDNMDAVEELDPSSCFICDQGHKSIEACMVHMHKKHGFFIPDAEYLKDPKGFLTYVGLKVKRDFMCLYCTDRCSFHSLEAVRKHMIAKGHCKVHYGDGGDEEEAELEEFYDYSSSYVDEDGNQLMALDDPTNTVELGNGGSELKITKKTDKGASVITLGSREFMQYYRQKPRPTTASDVELAVSLASRYRSIGLRTVQSKEQRIQMKVLKAMNRSGVEGMRAKIGMKSNVIRNLPNNVTY